MIAWKKHGYLSRANRAFADFLQEQTRGYDHPGGEQADGAPPRGNRPRGAKAHRKS